MKISVVIPNRNAGDFIGACLDSVVSQTGVDVEIIVMDGQSTDTSLHTIRKYADHLAHWESTPDTGPYNAIEKGFARATGDILCWLNSDDIFLPGALAEVAELFTANPEMTWMSGVHSSFLDFPTLQSRGWDKSYLFMSDETQYAVRQFHTTRHIEMSVDYLLDQAADGGYFLQQESTFWRRELWEEVGGFDPRYGLASDYWLWLEFLSRSPLTMVDRPFGCFRQSLHQRSEAESGTYLREVAEIARRYRAAQTFRNGPDAPLGHEIRVWDVVRDKLCIATSIAPVELDRQAHCIKTWQTHGARILSFNTATEIAIITDAGIDVFDGVEFVEVTDTARAVVGKDLVLLRDIMARFATFDPDICLGIVNADIIIDENIDLLGYVRRTTDSGRCLISSRVDISDLDVREGNLFYGGLDAFFFTAPMLQKFPMDTEFAIGSPWWDYFMPLYFESAGIPVAYARPTPFYHYRHTTNYPGHIWVHYGIQFLKYLDPDVAAAFDDTKGVGWKVQFLADIARQYMINFYNNCETASPVPWAAHAANGNGFHGKNAYLQDRVQQWTDRALLAEELLHQR